MDLNLEGIGQREVGGETCRRWQKRIGVSALGRVGEGGNGSAGRHGADRRVGVCGNHWAASHPWHLIGSEANCSGCFFSELYLFWLENSFEPGDVKSLSIAYPGPVVVKGRSPEWQSWFFTTLGVVCFSFTFPMTRLCLRTFDPILIALVRGAGAGVAALIVLVLSKSRTPERGQLVRLGSAALGMVVLFPILVSIALQSVPATHASVLGSILPLATAVFGVVRGRESVPRRFWIFAILGTCLIGLFSASRSGFHSVEKADVLLVAAFMACSYGYAEGGLLAREIGGWLVICWALVTVLPLELVALLVYGSRGGLQIGTAPAESWAALFYLTAISQFIGFFFYYKGLALGGIAKMSQVQLLLPFMAVFAAHWILGESIDGSVILGVLVMTGIVAAGRRQKRVGVSA
jgi:drug/metabolite transporter (DMT)-like permease